MAYERPRKGQLLKVFGTGSVESHAHTHPGSGSFYVLTDMVVNGFPRVFQIKWDPVDYMPVARNISPRSGEDHRYHYFLTMNHEWRVGDDLQLARRGQNNLDWESHGKIVKILFDKTTWSPSQMPKPLEADVYPVSPG